MKYLTAILCTLALVASCSKPAEKEFKVVAHRGYWNTEGAVRNSIASVRNAVTLGTFGSEFDVQVTADGVPVVHHDDKTTNGILIRDTTFEGLMAEADLLENGEKIPTLAEYLTAWQQMPQNNTKLILEIKSAATPEQETAAVEAILNQVNLFEITNDQIEYIAFSWFVCQELSRMAPEATVSYLNGDKTPAEIKEAGLEGIDYNYKVLRKNPQWVAEAHDLGLIVNAWTVNKPEAMQEMVDLNVDYITTDKPVELMELLGNQPEKSAK